MKTRTYTRRSLPTLLAAIASLSGGLIAHAFLPGVIWTLGVAASAASLVSVASVAIIEHERTRRAELPYRAERILAQAEAHVRLRAAKARTRRIRPTQLPTPEASPEEATDLTTVMRIARSAADLSESVPPHAAP